MRPEAFGGKLVESPPETTSLIPLPPSCVLMTATIAQQRLASRRRSAGICMAPAQALRSEDQARVDAPRRGSCKNIELRNTA